MLTLAVSIPFSQEGPRVLHPVGVSVPAARHSSHHGNLPPHGPLRRELSAARTLGQVLRPRSCAAARVLDGRGDSRGVLDAARDVRRQHEAQVAVAAPRLGLSENGNFA